MAVYGAGVGAIGVGGYRGAGGGADYSIVRSDRCLASEAAGGDGAVKASYSITCQSEAKLYGVVAHRCRGVAIVTALAGHVFINNVRGMGSRLAGRQD